jgi:hypothetical protein
MFNRELCTRVLQVAGSVVLCSYAVASQADPISLQAVCHLSSIAGGGRCDLFYQLSDSFTSPGAGARKSQIKVNGIVVANYVNDIANPVDFSISTVSGSVTVACGTSYGVKATVAAVGNPSSPSVGVGSLPSVLCPALP